MYLVQHTNGYINHETIRKKNREYLTLESSSITKV